MAMKSRFARSGLAYWVVFLPGVLLVAVATLVGRALIGVFAPANIVMFYLICVAITAMKWGLVPSIVTSLLSVLAFDFFLVPPYFTLTVADTQYILTFAVLFVVGLIISYLTARIRLQTEAAERKAGEMASLYTLSRSLTDIEELDDALATITQAARETFRRETVMLLPAPESLGVLRPYPLGSAGSLDGEEMAAATESFRNQAVVGDGTNTMPQVNARFVPLKTSRGTVGVMALASAGGSGEWTTEQTPLLETFASLAAAVIEHIQLVEEARNARALEATERLQTALLNAISHDLKTPLVSIIGALSSLEEGVVASETARMNLLRVAREEADRLNRLISGLLDESRIQAGAMVLSRQSVDVQDLIGAALEQLGGQARRRRVAVEVTPSLLLISVDCSLMVQALANVVDNALKYSPADAEVEISARKVSEEVCIEVADRGAGIPEGDLSRIFDKFYRIQRPDNVAGTGLGLYISKGIIEAHGGRTEAMNRPEGGAIIRLIVPAGKPLSGGPGAGW